MGAPRPGTPSPRWGWGAHPLLHPPVLAGKATRERGPCGGAGCRWGGIKGGAAPACPRSRSASAGSATWPHGPSARDRPGPRWTSPTATAAARTRSPSAASRYSGCPLMRPGCLRGRVRVVSPNSGFPRLQLSEPQGSPGFLLFLCRLLSPMLRTYTRAVAFLDRPSWPQPGRTPPGWATASPTTLAPLGLAFGETEVQPKLPCRPGSALRPERGCAPLGAGDGGI